MSIKTGIAALTLGVFAIAPAMIVPAVAQTTAPGPAGSPNTIPEKKGAPLEGRSDSLSNRLSKTDGVITPNSNVDPGMHVPAPDPHPNSMPVIPPNATGGDNAK
jgi:hypothetical protein